MVGCISVWTAWRSVVEGHDTWLEAQAVCTGRLVVRFSESISRGADTGLAGVGGRFVLASGIGRSVLLGVVEGTLIGGFADGGNAGVPVGAPIDPGTDELPYGGLPYDGTLPGAE